MNKPKVSVCMIAYNHEAYIEEAIQGVLNQETNFAIELIISNDASTDKTNEIISNLVNNSKSISIKYFNQVENIGMMPNFIFTLEECKGDYIALCEGDDYWTDPLKLQKQVDFLEENPDYSMCFHQVSNIRDGKVIENFPSYNLSQTFTLEDMFSPWFIPTCSMVFKNNIILPKWMNEVVSGDFVLHFLIAEKGYLFFLKENMAVYRLHEGGISRIHNGYYKAIGMTRIYNFLNIYFDGKYRELIDKQIEFEINRNIVLPTVEKAINKVKRNYESKKIIKLENKIKKILGLKKD